MEMAQLVEVIKDRQEKSGLSVERYANEMEVTSGALYNYLAGKRREIAPSIIRRMARFYNEQGDAEAVKVIITYATGLDNIQILPST